MAKTIQSLLGIASLFAVTAASASAQARPAGAPSTVECDGGTVHSAKEAARYYACETIVGDLSIEGTTLSDLSDFGNVRRVQGALTITHNASLQSLSALSELRSVRSVEISHNAELDDLVGLGGLRRLDGLVLRHNGILRTAGLEKLESVGALVIADNQNLLSLSGLDHLTRAHSLEITHNPRLWGQLGLLPNIKHVSGEIVVERNLGISKAEVTRFTERVKPVPAVALANN